MLDQRFELTRGRDQAVEIHPGLVAHALQHVHDILGRDVARRTRRIGAAADAAQRHVERPDARIDSRDGVDEAHRSRVVKMSGHLQTRIALDRALAQRVDLRGIRHASGVAQRDAAHAESGETGDPVEHDLRIDVAFHRAAERTRQRHIHRHVCALCEVDHVGELPERLLARHSQVRQVVCLAARHHEIELVDLRGNRALGPFHVRDQRGVDDARLAPDPLHHIGTVGERRNRFRRRERRHLDLRVAEIAESVDQSHLVRGRNEPLFHLEPVARRHFVDRQPDFLS